MVCYSQLGVVGKERAKSDDAPIWTNSNFLLMDLSKL